MGSIRLSFVKIAEKQEITDFFFGKMQKMNICTCIFARNRVS